MSTHPAGAQVKRGLAWIGVASSLVSVLDSLALLIILNRWGSKDDYGIATTCTWVFPILDQATDLGLSAAVIQHDDHSDTKLATVFWLSLGIGSSVFAPFVVGASIVAPLLDHPIVAWMMMVYASKLVSRPTRTYRSTRRSAASMITAGSRACSIRTTRRRTTTTSVSIRRTRRQPIRRRGVHGSGRTGCRRNRRGSRRDELLRRGRTLALRAGPTRR